MSVARIDAEAVCQEADLLKLLPPDAAPRALGGDAWLARCTFHEDRTPSMRVARTKSGWAFFCYACGAKGDAIRYVQETRKLGFLDAVRAVTGGTLPPAVDLNPRPIKNRDAAPKGIASRLPGNSAPVAEYDYFDEAGVLLYQVLRYEPKTFRQRQPHPFGGWLWTMRGVRRVLYRLPELLEAPLDRTVYVVEGEKDVEALRAIGRVATCNVGGAGPGKWLPSYSESLRGRKVLVVPDNDGPGQKHAEAVRAALVGVAASVELWPLPASVKDISDLLAKRQRDQQPKE